MISNQKINRHLKEIATICGINKKLTFHSARHTFATTITLTNGMPIETVSKMLGHNNLRTTQIYAKVIDAKLVLMRGSYVKSFYNLLSLKLSNYTSMFSLDYIHKITLSDVPIQWMTRIELFTPDLEQFPLMYIHKFLDKEECDIVGEYNPSLKQRVWLILSSRSINPKANSLCELEIEFVCNILQKHHHQYDKKIINEVSHRIGLANRVGYKDLANICKNQLCSPTSFTEDLDR